MVAMPVETLLSADQIQTRIHELAKEIDADLGGETPVLVAILKGSVHFFSDLARAMETDAELDFMQVSSYHGGKSSTGVVQIRKDLDINIEGRHVVLVEDIVDTGTTLAYLLELLETRHPKSLQGRRAPLENRGADHRRSGSITLDLTSRTSLW